jgi:hypothetical protein
MRFRFAPGAPILGALFMTSALTLAAGPAVAQVQLGNPNAANESFAVQGQFRAIQQQRTADFNTLNMQAQRNVQFTPSYEGYPHGILPRARHRGDRAGRIGRVGRPSRGFDMGICTGC